MLRIYEQAAELGYRPTRFLQMVQERGGIEAARDLIDRQTPSSGFTRLWELKRLDLSVEALATSNEFRSLFSDEHIDIATKRLVEYEWEQSP